MNQRFGAALWVLLCCLLPAVAAGHAVNLGSDPVNNAQMESAPERLEVRFNEAVTPVFVRLYEPLTGERMTLDGSPYASGQSVVLELPENLSDGGYVVSWRVISADSHPVGGAFRFSIGAEPVDWAGTTELATAQATEWSALTVLYALIRALFLLGLLTFFGALVHLWWTARRLGYGESEWRWLSAAAATTIAAGGLQVVLQGLRMYGPEFEWSFFSAAMNLGWQSTLGQSSGVSMVALAMAWALLFWRNNRVMLLVALLLAALAMIGLVMTGHVATGPNSIVTVPALALHVLTAGFWLGALPMLLLTTRHGSRQTLIHTLQRFSRTAMSMVALLVVAGLAIATLQVESLDGLFNTAYGRFLLLKVLLVVLMLLVAVDNKWRITQGLIHGLPDMRVKLQRNIKLEWLGMVVVLLVTAAIAIQPPPRADLGQHDDHDLPYGEMGEVVSTRLPGSPWELDLQLAHDNIGENQLILAFYDTNGEVQRPQEVQVRFSLPELDLESSRQSVEAVGPIFLLTVEDIVLPGQWQIEIEALVSDFELTRYEFVVDLGR